MNVIIGSRTTNKKDREAIKHTLTFFLELDISREEKKTNLQQVAHTLSASRCIDIHGATVIVIWKEVTSNTF